MIWETSYDPGKVIFNFSSHQLSDDEKSIFCKVLKFSALSKYLDFADHMLPFELLFRDSGILIKIKYPMKTKSS